MPDVGDVGVAVIAVIYIVKLGLDFLLKFLKKPQDDPLASLKTQVHDLHEWHDAKDNDQVFVWYVRQSLADAVVDLNKNVEQLARILESIASERKKR